MSTATDMRDKYIAAEVAVLAGQSYHFGERSLTLADLAEIRAGRAEWESKAAAETRLAAGGPSPRYQVADFGGGCR